MTTFVSAGKLSSLDKCELSCVDKALYLVVVTVFLALNIEVGSHGRDEMTIGLESGVNVVHRVWRHVVWHENARGAGTVILAFELLWKLVNSLAKEEDLCLVIPVLGPYVLDQLLGGIESVDVSVALLGQHLGDLSSATPNV